ncbi:MAG: HEPN domain-containing protein [Deltaproteobacteria bacterium]|jgi:HEPN domain-containing protein|nr:HEPN domain-containing protein [Deltaproteobacteria bacterium]
MDDQDKFDFWLDTAQYDISTAISMFNTGRWVYVAFMCQQAIEKLIKGLYILYIDDNVPRIHNICILLDKFIDKLPVAVDQTLYKFFETLSVFYINTRYTSYKQKIQSIVNKQEAESILSKTKEVFAWLLTLKP